MNNEESMFNDSQSEDMKKVLKAFDEAEGTTEPKHPIVDPTRPNRAERRRQQQEIDRQIRRRERFLRKQVRDAYKELLFTKRKEERNE